MTSNAWAAIGLLAIGTMAVAEPPLPIAIKDAHVVTGTGADLAKGTIILRNGLIEAVGEGIAIPPDAGVIDGAGLTVYPGFIDALSTWGIPGAAPATARAAGAGTTPPGSATQPAQPAERIHGPEDRPQTHAAERAADQVAPTDPRLPVARAAGFSSAASFTNRGIFTGQGAMVDLAGERGRDMVVAQPIGQEVAFRFGGGGLGRAFPGSLMGNISYVRQLYLDLDQYKTAHKLYAEHPGGTRRPEYDKDLVGLEEAPRLLLPAVEKQQIERMVVFGKELKVPYVLYGLHEGYDEINVLKAANVPLVVSLKWPEKAKDSNPMDQSDYRDLVLREKAPSVPALLAKAGVKFAFSTDGIESAGEIKKAVRKALDAGLSRNDAIRALTLTPAEFYGVADRMGSLEKGKIANLVLMRGEAFDDKTLVEALFIDGVEFQPSKDLQQAPGEGREGSGGRRPRLAMTDDGDIDGGAR